MLVKVSQRRDGFWLREMILKNRPTQFDI